MKHLWLNPSLQRVAVAIDSFIELEDAVEKQKHITCLRDSCFSEY